MFVNEGFGNSDMLMFFIPDLLVGSHLEQHG